MNHFEGKYEVEFKYKISSKETALERLIAENAEEFIIGNTETDYFFDYADNRLQRENKSLVIREMKPSGKILWIVKGPGPDHCEALDLDDCSKALSMLENMGFILKDRFTKNRDIYFIDKFHITIDDLKNVGTFAEVATMTNDQSILPSLAKQAQTLATTLGFMPENIEKRSYREIFSTLSQQGSALT